MTLVVWMIALVQLYGPAEAAGAIEMTADVVYREIDGEQLALDLFYPSPRGESMAAVVFIHGGAWALNNRRDYHDFARGFARSGVVGVTPDYRGQPPDGFRGMTDDIKAAVRWLRSNAADLDIDPDRIGIFGSSSGGHLAGLVSMADDSEWIGVADRDVSSDVQAAFLLFGIYDLTTSPLVKLVQAIDPGPPFGIPVANLPLFSPTHYVSGGEPRTYMMHGTDDLLVPLTEARGLRDALAASGVPVTLQEVKGKGHGFIKTNPWLRPLIYWSVRDFFLNAL